MTDIHAASCYIFHPIGKCCTCGAAERLAAELAQLEEKFTKYRADFPLTKTDADYITERLGEAADVVRENAELSAALCAITKHVVIHPSTDMPVDDEVIACYDRLATERDDAMLQAAAECVGRHALQAKLDDMQASLVIEADVRFTALNRMALDMEDLKKNNQDLQARLDKAETKIVLLRGERSGMEDKEGALQTSLAAAVRLLLHLRQDTLHNDCMSDSCDACHIDAFLDYLPDPTASHSETKQ